MSYSEYPVPGYPKGKPPRPHAPDLANDVPTYVTKHFADAMAKDDPVNSPSHYNQFGIEAIDAIKASMTPEEFLGYLKGNALKYLWRYRYKGNPVQDLKKAQWYLNKLIDATDKEMSNED